MWKLFFEGCLYDGTPIRGRPYRLEILLHRSRGADQTGVEHEPVRYVYGSPLRYVSGTSTALHYREDERREHPRMSYTDGLAIHHTELNPRSDSAEDEEDWSRHAGSLRHPNTRHGWY